MQSRFPVPGSKERRDSLLKCQAGILVTEDLEQAVKHCRDRVERLARECLEGNRKFRDLEFDLLEDKASCLHRLGYDPQNPRYKPADVRRVTEMVKDPRFFVDDATASDICQGYINNCWFLSALAVVATTTRVIDRICVARDEKVGIYGFIFWRDSGWAEVIIDDLLCTKIPPWNHLSTTDRAMFRNDKWTYNNRARQGLFENLYFAKSKTDNETWVPLIEKAYAKLHGDYESLENGFTSEGVEDLTGGVSTIIYTRDILDTDKFWNEELLNVGKDHLFACFTPGTIPGTSGKDLAAMGGEEYEGLITGHAYSVTRAVDFVSEDGKHEGRFLRIRNPWGRKEWSGRWADGSEQWNEEWTDQLRKKLGDDESHPYKFGDDGEFVQEYTDFLDCWEIIERSRLFDDGWKMSSQWLTMPPDAHLTPWSMGDLSFTVDIDTASETNAEEAKETVIVLAQRDERYFKELAGVYRWSMDFLLYRRDEKVPIARSVHSTLWDRSVKLEVKLVPGRYIIHARLDCRLKDNPADLPDWRKRNRKQMALAASAIIATNCHDHSLLSQHLTLPPRELAGSDLGEIELRAHLDAIKFRRDTERLLAGEDRADDASGRQPHGISPTFPPSPRPGTVSDKLTLATNHSISKSGSLDTRYSLITPATDAPVQELTVLYDGEMRRMESPTSEELPINTDLPPPRKGSRSSRILNHEPTRFCTAPTSFGTSIDAVVEGRSQGGSRITWQGDSTPRLGGSASNARSPSPSDTAGYPAAEGEQAEREQVPQVSARQSGRQDPTSKNSAPMNSHQPSSGPPPPSRADEFRTEQLQIPSKAITGPMIHCIDIACHDLNLCVHCKDLRIHPDDHHVMVSMCKEDDIAIRHKYSSPNISDATSSTDSDGKARSYDLPPSDLLLGLRVYTRLPFKAKVKGQLRTGSVLRNHYFTPKPSGILDGHHQNESEINSTG
ncbi:hypothetical protein FRC04_005850 [Tulasnella sp. 424]|nr:hypothetical protein FRC04_005850 [Tulasnella sp. 424]